MRQLSNSPLFFGLTLITLLVLLAILAPLLTVHNPFSTNVDNWLRPQPSTLVQTV